MPAAKKRKKKIVPVPVKTMTETKWEHKYRLVPNHLNPDATWYIDDGPGHLFETFGKELLFVLDQDHHKVWTLLEDDAGVSYVRNGMHVVNRVGYFVSEKPWPAGTEIMVILEEPR